jgi:hypothetical protein
MKKIILVNILIAIFFVFTYMLFINGSYNVDKEFIYLIVIIFIFYVLFGIPLTILILLFALFFNWKSIRK